MATHWSLAWSEWWCRTRFTKITTGQNNKQTKDKSGLSVISYQSSLAQGAISAWAKRRHLPSDSFTALCNMREVFSHFSLKGVTWYSKCQFNITPHLSNFNQPLWYLVVNKPITRSRHSSWMTLPDWARRPTLHTTKWYSSNCRKLKKQKTINAMLQVKDIYLHPALFTVQSGLLSTSGVLMRQKLVEI